MIVTRNDMLNYVILPKDPWRKNSIEILDTQNRTGAVSLDKNLTGGSHTSRAILLVVN